MDQTSGNLDPAAHPARERLDLRAAPLDEIDGFQDLLNIDLALRLGNAVELRIDTQVLFDGKIRVAGESLRNDANHAPDRVGLLGNVMSGDDRFAPRERNQRSHHADQRALARPVWPQKAKDLTRRY